MRPSVLFACLLLSSCSSGPIAPLDLAGSDLAGSDLASDDGAANDPCGSKYNGAYSCAYLTGTCPTPGLSCFCWERGTMVCQADHKWELILDGTHCPETRQSEGYQGLGCLGAAAQCDTCTCDPKASIYQCPDGGM